MQEEKKNPAGADTSIEPDLAFQSNEPEESGEGFRPIIEQEDLSVAFRPDLSLGEEPLSALSGELPEQPEMKPEKKKKRKKKRRIGGVIYVICILSFSVLLAAGIIMVGNDIFGMFKEDKEIQVNIPQGASTAEIAEVLKAKGVIEHPWLFRFTSRIGHHDGTYQWGLYELNPKMPYSDIIDALKQIAPDMETVSLTIDGSMSVVEIAHTLESNRICTAEEFLDSLQSESHGFAFEEEMLVDRLKFQKTEGYMFPGEYSFFVGENVDTVIEKFYQNFDQNICQGLKKELADSNMSLERVLTIASLIEAERVDPSEMPIMASVLLNRLNNPMKYPRFELNSTRSYADQIIKKYALVANAEVCDAYNTFVCDGLPIGPICNPSLEAVRAVLDPAQSNYYFYYVDNAAQTVQYMETQAEYDAVAAANEE